MAFTYGFYNSVNHDRKYDAVQMGQIFDGIITDGIYATYLKAMVVKASSNASEVIVQPGRAWFNHTWSYNDADYPVAAPEPEVVLDRIDTLVLDINAEDASRTNSFLWVQGTPTSQIPEPPTLIHTVTHNQYPLCDVYRKAGTTQIYAADITNRVGTSDCPFVTGVLESINIDDLLAQWDDEFHTWENATKASFEGWMINKQSVYTAWWDALKAQMAGDVANVEAWIETIHDILDEEVATRLQAEIDEIKTELPSGSHITVTTTDTELYSRTVTITDEANHTVTSQFDATGVAVFKTVPYVGNLTISSTDGTRTATSVVQTPYFARYEFAIAFWNATVNIDGTSELGGAIVTITDSSEALVGMVVLNASGLGVFNATYPDTYKFSVTHGGETMSVTLEVSQETTYNVEIHGGFNWQRWVDLSENYSSSDFDDLDELLADQKAVRELMTIHACVDYMAEATRADANITKIINNNICAKWINLRDYALDTLHANSAIAAVMDAADKYFYGEWVNNNGTWGPKGAVPVMTSNTAPYGTASAYQVFDGNASTTASGTDFSYKFVNPICPKDFYCNVSGGTLQASNDGSTWSVPTSGSYYLYLRLHFASSVSPHTIQFYGRQLTVSVPVMTSNTAPFGEAFADSESSASYAAWKAFDGDNNSYAAGTSKLEHYWGYVFPSDVKVKMAMIYSSSIPVDHMYIESADSKNGEFSGEEFTVTASSSYKYFITLSEVQTNKAIRFRAKKSTNFGGAINLQFYGLDYSEKEFEPGTTKKWLYDHGVELETMTAYTYGANTVAQKNSDNLHVEVPASTQRQANFMTSLNLTAYNLYRAIYGDVIATGASSSACSLAIFSSNPTGYNPSGNVAKKTVVPPDNNLPNNISLDISAVTGINYIGIYTANSSDTITKKGEVKELWLE